jgi:hypothetical protein
VVKNPPVIVKMAERRDMVDFCLAMMDLICLSWLGPGRGGVLASARYFWYQYFMAKSIRGTKKSRGRPPTTGTGVQLGMRWPEPLMHAIDDWRREETDLPSRAEAIRRLVERGLKAKR